MLETLGLDTVVATESVYDSASPRVPSTKLGEKWSDSEVLSLESLASRKARGLRDTGARASPWKDSMDIAQWVLESQQNQFENCYLTPCGAGICASQG